MIISNTMIDEEIWLALFRILLEIRNLPCLEEIRDIKFPVRTKETEAIMVLLN